MDFIKDKTKCISAVNELISSCGEPAQLAQKVDDVTFDYISSLCRGNECVNKHTDDVIFALKSIRDFFVELQTT
jgi:hypothetical protein